LKNKKKFGISVILTVYNRKDKILRAVNSVLSQSFKNWELIIVDDGSTDGTENIIFPLLKKHPRIKYLRHSNKGTALSLNAGLLNSEGKYITFLDSDDEYKKEHLKIRYDFLKANTKADLIHTNCTFIGRDEDMYVPDARNKKRLIHISECISGATFFGKKEVFEKLKGFKKVYSYDSEFYRRAKRKFYVIELNSPTYIYNRDSKDSVLTKLKKKLNNKNEK
jgi:glycosyltransferase involved in cell wall biosynthesis